MLKLKTLTFNKLAFKLQKRMFSKVYYAKTHEWISVDKNIATVGISDFAQHELGEVVHVEPAKVGEKVKSGESLVKYKFYQRGLLNQLKRLLIFIRLLKGLWKRLMRN
jgi:hypothetical protein